MNKRTSIAEIGLNHLGSESYTKYYLKKLLKSKISGISFQIKKDSWYKEYYKSFKKNDHRFSHKIRDGKYFINLIKNKKFIKLKLPRKLYKYAANLCRKKGKLIGFALSNKKDLSFLKKLDVDFIKILNEDFDNVGLIKSVLRSKIKTVLISVGNKKRKEIANLIRLLNHNRKIVLIYTEFLKDKPDFKNLKRLKKFNLRFGYGNHSKDLKYINYCQKYKPDFLLFYVKGKSFIFHPDEYHSVPVKQINKFIRN